MISRFARALLAPAAVAAAIALAGCNGDTLSPTGRALAPLSDQMIALLQQKHMDKTSPILLQIYKEESQLEVWKVNQDGQYALLKTYPICRWSGQLGPKKKEGDRQAPEGFYTITKAQMNPNSNYYLSFNTGYPNAFDRAWGRTGSELMVHGDCSSRGCYAMTDGQIQEIYALAREAFFGGQKAFQLQAFPFRMTALNMAKHRNNPNYAFWKQLKRGYDDFEATRQEPTVNVCDKHYVFDAVAREGATRPLRFSPRGKCPEYRLDPTVASAVLDYRRQQQLKMAQYIADGVGTVPIAKNSDGGMNEVFASSGKLRQGQIDKDGRVYNTADLSATPVAAPALATVPATVPAARLTKTAMIPLPQRSPLDPAAPKAKPSGITGLIDNIFGGKASAEAAPAKTDTAPARTEAAAKSKPRRKRTAHKQAHLRPSVTANKKPKTATRNTPKPAPAPARQQAAKGNEAPESTKKPAAPQTQADKAQPSADGMMTGSQPVVRTGSFDARWHALR
ncbi:MAG: L,D-transpeptidase family protein [Pseudolabrys sp.]